MTLFSIVIPVHGVQAYLRECLDSVLGQSFRDFEVIAVDDASPDRSGEILAEYAARDPRLTVLTLPAREDVGPARNAGLARATGDYVWFLDGDDALAPGALGAVARRIRATDADVVVVDHRRVIWDGKVEKPVAGAVLRAAPEVFTLGEWPRAVNLLHVVWNKVVKRSLLDDLRFEFQPGWYEDVPFTYEVLGTAQRITALDRVCVHYRRRRRGAATATVSTGHFAIFPNWEQVFVTLEAHGGLSAAATTKADTKLRAALFSRMMWHYLMVFGNESRIARAKRPEFFARMVEHYRRFRPTEGYAEPGGLSGIKHRLVARGSYQQFEAVRVGYRAAAKARGVAGRAVRGLERRARRVARGGRNRLHLLYYRAQLRMPVDPKLALFAAYWYRGKSCNPGAVYDRLGELDPSVKGVWVVRRDRAHTLPKGTPHVIAGTRAYYRALARARWLVNNVNYPNEVVKRPGTTHLMTHHGTPLKVMGTDQVRYPGGMKDNDIHAQIRRSDRWDFSVAQNPHSSEVWERAYPCRYESLETGYPRNDRLATATPEEVARIRQSLGIEPGQRVVLYAPTHREYHPGFVPQIDVEEFVEELGPDTVVLSRAHYFYVPPPKGASAKRAGRVIDASEYPVVEDLYLAADVLITDYSSLMFDYAVLDRPIVIFAPDWEVYKAIRGVTFDLFAEPPGAIATTQEGLLDLFRTGAYAGDAAAKAREVFRARFCALEDGRAAERVVRRVFLQQAH